jgi:hypothetical protein
MKNSELFSNYGYAYISNVLTKEQCERFSNILLDMKNANQLAHEGSVDALIYKESYGGNHEEFEAALREIQPRIEEEIGLKMKPANSYGRIYYNGGTLPPHKDRSVLDYTLSITLKHNLEKDWPLWCTDKKGNNVPLYIAEGDGGIMIGNSMTHWRDPLVCSPEQFSINLFMHWSLV